MQNGAQCLCPHPGMLPYPSSVAGLKGSRVRLCSHCPPPMRERVPFEFLNETLSRSAVGQRGTRWLLVQTKPARVSRPQLMGLLDVEGPRLARRLRRFRRSATPQRRLAEPLSVSLRAGLGV